MALILQEVPLKYVHNVWPYVESFLSAAIKHAEGEITLEEAKVHCTQGGWILLVAVDEENKIHGAATFYCFNRINDRVAYITTMGGRGVVTPEVYSQLETIARNHGATCIEGVVRDSMLRFMARFGAKKKTATFQITL